MKKLFLFATLSLFLVSKNYSQDWITFNSSEGKFSVLLPVQPSVQRDTSETYPKYTTTLFMSKSATDLFIIGWADYESAYTFDPQKELEANRDNFIKAIKGTLVSSSNTKFNGYQAIEFTANAGTYFWTSRVFIVGRRPYQLLTGSNTGKASVNETKFFNSFSMTN